MIIIKYEEANDKIDDFINQAFAEYAGHFDVNLNYEEYCFAAEEDGDLAGVITGYAYYNEVRVVDLVVAEKYRRLKVGSNLVEAVEKEFSGKGYDKLTLTTFGFQAPEFYKKLGYELEFVRRDSNPKLTKYFYIKAL